MKHKNWLREGRVEREKEEHWRGYRHGADLFRVSFEVFCRGEEIAMHSWLRGEGPRAS